MLEHYFKVWSVNFPDFPEEILHFHDISSMNLRSDTRRISGNFRNNPGSSSVVKFGFNVPQTGPYADEGADELRAYQLAVKHLNGEGDGGTDV